MNTTITTDTNQMVAIITGAGSGVGEQVAIQLSNLGYRCVLVGRTLEKLDQVGARLTSDSMVVAGDVGIDSDRAKIIDLTIQRFGRIDALINNAGVAIFCKMAEMTPQHLKEMFAANGIGPVDLTRRVIGQMSTKKSGVIVNVSSIAQLDPFDGLGVYGCTKGPLGVLAKAIANEYGETGVRGYTLCPGAIETSMLRSFLSKEVLPTNATLSAQEVARRIVELVVGEGDVENGAVVEMPSG